MRPLKLGGRAFPSHPSLILISPSPLLITSSFIFLFSSPLWISSTSPPLYSLQLPICLFSISLFSSQPLSLYSSISHPYIAFSTPSLSLISLSSPPPYVSSLCPHPSLWSTVHSFVEASVTFSWNRSSFGLEYPGHKQKCRLTLTAPSGSFGQI